MCRFLSTHSIFHPIWAFKPVSHGVLVNRRLANLRGVFEPGKRIICVVTSCYENCRYISYCQRLCQSVSVIYKIRLSFSIKVSFRFVRINIEYFMLLIKVQSRGAEQLSTWHCDGNAKTTTASCTIHTATARRIWGIWWHFFTSRLSLIVFALV